VTVKKNLSTRHKINSIRRYWGTSIGSREVEPIVVAGSYLSVYITLEYPHKLFYGVVEVEAEFVVGGVSECKWFRTLELYLVNEVLVRHLSESAALIRIKVYIIDVEGSILERDATVENCSCARGSIAITSRRKTDNKFVSITEFHLNTNFVVLKSN
jgi:hypothetical protein